MMASMIVVPILRPTKKECDPRGRQVAAAFAAVGK